MSNFEGSNRSGFTDTMELLFTDPQCLPGAPTDGEILAAIKDANPGVSTQSSVSPDARKGFLEMWHIQQVIDFVGTLDSDELADTASRAQFNAKINTGFRAIRGMRVVATTARAELARRQNEQFINGGQTE